MANVRSGTKGFVSRPLAERFWEKVNRTGPNECWEWTGSVHSAARPYGQIWVDGRACKATRVSWELANSQPVPEGKMICHSCDNPICVNPAHLWPGTMSDNIKDAVAKGRHKPGGWYRAALQSRGEK
jgi:hypothetical protein